MRKSSLIKRKRSLIKRKSGGEERGRMIEGIEEENE